MCRCDDSSLRGRRSRRHLQQNSKLLNHNFQKQQVFYDEMFTEVLPLPLAVILRFKSSRSKLFKGETLMRDDKLLDVTLPPRLLSVMVILLLVFPSFSVVPVASPLPPEVVSSCDVGSF